MLEGVLDAYWQRHSTGGCLHIVIDDGNWTRSAIDHCVNYAWEQNDFIGWAIAEMLACMPDEALEECNELGWQFGVEKWKDVIRSNSVDTD